MSMLAIKLICISFLQAAVMRMPLTLSKILFRTLNKHLSTGANIPGIVTD